MSKRILLTGAGGFVGSHVLRHVLTYSDWEVVCPVTFAHRGKHDRIASALVGNEGWHKRVKVVMWDLSTPCTLPTWNNIRDIDQIWNIASESHVDRSIEDPSGFILNNVALMLNVLDYARLVEPELILQMSTDEVYGPAPEDYAHVEWDAIKPSNPYSASKASQEAIAFSYWRTYDLPIVITNTMNIIGEMQDPEKFVPMIIKKILNGEEIPVHVSPEGVSGSRFYLHARNLADAWLTIGQTMPQLSVDEAAKVPLSEMAYRYVPRYPMHSEPARYHIVGEREVSNVEMVQLIARQLGVDPKMKFVNFHGERPGHDLRYALNGEAIERDFGWTAPISFEESLRRTVEWTLENPEWLL